MLFFSLFPALIYYSRFYPKNKKPLFDIKIFKETIFAFVISISIIIVFWPNSFLLIGSSAFSEIGILDKRTHYYNIASDKYYKDLFPKSIPVIIEDA
ncbi:hypothetical protein C5467_24790 [Photorhabdus khanii subsp. guanajuatensis]|uniref:Uncharacterized protein n=1 Tax=Photorhabdus khanii subsp. guanajuatensis TaxID=2100166 RepID=A0A4R4IJV2_9GAMM|nr:hypothetical protein C5467_24790 [Photorhabdus khanii subsp. guanajuatensis]